MPASVRPPDFLLFLPPTCEVLHAAGGNERSDQQSDSARTVAGSGPTLVWGGIAVAEERARAVHELSWAASLSSRLSYPILVSGRTRRRGRLFHLDRI